MVKSIKYRKITKVKVELSEPQQEVLDLLTNLDYALTPQQIADKRGTTVQAVRKIINSLKKNKVLKHQTSLQTENKTLIKQKIKQGTPWRGHGHNFTINILSSSPTYETKRKKQSGDDIDTNTLRLYKNKIVLHGNKDFWGEDVDSVMWQSQRYTNELITGLENKYDILLRKPNKLQIKEFRFHLANVNDPDAKRFLEQGKQIKIRNNDGQIIMSMDNSFVPEVEFEHKETAPDNAKIWQKHRTAEQLHPEALTVAELTQIISDQTKQNKTLQENIITMSEQVNLLVMSHSNTESALQRTIESQQLMIESQRALFDQLTIKTPTISQEPPKENDDKDIGNYFN